jgi:hypothetical protein
MLRERVTAYQQEAETRQTWSSTSYRPKSSTQIRSRLIRTRRSLDDLQAKIRVHSLEEIRKRKKVSVCDYFATFCWVRVIGCPHNQFVQ